MKLSIIMPVYNEAKTVELISEKVLSSPLGDGATERELIIVDDLSTDGTREILKNIQGRFPEVKVVMKERNQGKGSAVREGIKHTTGDIVLFQDADLEYDPEDYPHLLRPILQGKADVVYGSRFLGVHRCFMFWHYVGNKVLCGLTNILFNTILTDMETCYKVFKREVLEELSLCSNDFCIEAEITAKILKKRVRIYEVPISYYGRSYEEGKKISWKDGVKTIVAILKYRLLN